MVWRRALQGAPVANAMDAELIPVRGNQYVNLALFQRNIPVSNNDILYANREKTGMRHTLTRVSARPPQRRPRTVSIEYRPVGMADAVATGALKAALTPPGVLRADLTRI